MRTKCTACGCEVPAGAMHCNGCGVAIFATAHRERMPSPATREVPLHGGQHDAAPATRSVQFPNQSGSDRAQAGADGTRHYLAEHCRPLFSLIAFGAGGTPIEFRLLRTPRTVLGREAGDLLIINDPAVSSQHAQLEYRSDMSLVLSDLGSKNGTFIRLRPRQGLKLWENMKLIIGRQILQYRSAEPPTRAATVPRTQTRTFVSHGNSSSHGCLALQSPDGQSTQEFALGDRVVIGRSNECNIVFSNDDYVSPTHAMLEYRAKMQGMVVRDLQSINGVYVSARQPVVLEDGDVFRVGEQLFSVTRCV